MVRKPLSTQVNRYIILYATFEGLHLPKNGGFDTRTILLKQVVQVDPPRYISDHLWTSTDEHEKYQEFQNGDRIKIFGKVIKYFRYFNKRPEKDFTVKIISCKKVDV